MDLQLATVELEFDEDGFLKDPNRWNEEVAEFIASQDGIAPLGAHHWDVIWSLRAYYFKYHVVPAIPHICYRSNLGKNCLDTLFSHSSKEAWRIAGLPNPGEEAKAYM